MADATTQNEWTIWRDEEHRRLTERSKRLAKIEADPRNLQLISSRVHELETALAEAKVSPQITCKDCASLMEPIDDDWQMRGMHGCLREHNTPGLDWYCADAEIKA